MGRLGGSRRFLVAGTAIALALLTLLVPSLTAKLILLTVIAVAYFAVVLVWG